MKLETYFLNAITMEDNEYKFLFLSDDKNTDICKWCTEQMNNIRVNNSNLKINNNYIVLITDNIKQYKGIINKIKVNYILNPNDSKNDIKAQLFQFLHISKIMENKNDKTRN